LRQASAVARRARVRRVDDGNLEITGWRRGGGGW
jgi:hypothetical protein